MNIYTFPSSASFLFSIKFWDYKLQRGPLPLAALNDRRPQPPNLLDSSLRIELGSVEGAQTRQFLAFSAPLQWTVSAPAFRHNCLDSKKKVGYF
jgi:hypothetical protein